MTLVERVAAALEQRGVSFALIGAGALAVRGVARSTFDLDLFTTDTSVLDVDFWTELARDGVTIDVRCGDADDPLAGVVRCRAGDERDVDLAVGRAHWQQAVIDRATAEIVSGVRLPVATATDLVLLKLYAGGSQDMWDIEQLLQREDDGLLTAGVEERLAGLPPDAVALWRRITGARD